MPDILVRGLPVELKKRLEARAHQSGRSLSAEVKALLQDALRTKDTATGACLWSRMRDSLPEASRLDEDLVPPREMDDRPLPDLS